MFTAGGAQALLKGHGVVVGERVVVAGTGPFLLPVAAGLAAAGARVVGVFEAGSPLGFARHPVAVLRNPGKLAEGAGYLRALRRHRVPFHTRTDRDRRARRRPGRGGDRRQARPRLAAASPGEIECDAVAVGYGFTPQLEIPLQLGCATRLDADGSLVATADDEQRASVPGVYLAGEVCGVGGAQLSVVEGEIAGQARGGRRRPPAAAAAHGPPAGRSRPAMHRTYPVRPAGRPGWPTTPSSAAARRSRSARSGASS